MFAAGDELLLILSCDIIGVPCSMPLSRSGYSSSSGGKDIGVVVVVVVGLVVELCCWSRCSPLQLVLAPSTPFELMLHPCSLWLVV